MTIESHRLVGVDYSGAKHEYFERHHNKKRAALALLKKKTHLARVYDGREELSKGRPNKGYLITVLAFRPGFEPNGTETTLTTFNQLGESLTQAQAEVQAERLAQGADTAQMIIRGLENKGATLELVEDANQSRIIISPKGITTETDRQDLKDHHDTIINVLKERAHAQDQSDPKPEMNGSTDKKTQRTIFCEHVLPHLPNGQYNFIRHDVERLLHKAGYHDIADNSQQVSALIYDAEKQKLVEKVVVDGTPVRGSFHVRDEVAKRFSRPAEATPEPAAPPAPPKPPEPSPVEAPEVMSRPLLPRPEGLQKLFESIGLVMATTLVDLPDPDELDRAASEFQDTILQAGETYLAKVKQFTSRVRQMREMKDTLRNNLTSTPTT